MWENVAASLRPHAPPGYYGRDAEPARRRSAGARLPARRGPRLALRAPRTAPAGRPGADPQGPRGGEAGDARRLPLQEDRFLAGSEGAVHRLGLPGAVG